MLNAANLVNSPNSSRRTEMAEGVDVYFGDCRDMSIIPRQTINFFMTSPPYWDLKRYGKSDSREVGQSTYEDYIDDMQSVWDQCYEKATANAVLVININSRRHQKRFYPIAFDIVAKMKGWRLLDHVIWYIPNALPQPNHYMERLLDNKFESCLVFTKDGSMDYTFHKPRVPQKYLTADPRSHNKNARGRCLGNILRIPAYRPPNIKKMGYHMAAYPEELVSFFLECFTDVGDTILDPFAGSGTTLKVARVMARRAIGFELHEEYEELLRKRITEAWAVPDWRNLDILHSASMQTGMQGSRKSHFLRKDASDLFKQE